MTATATGSQQLPAAPDRTSAIEQLVLKGDVSRFTPQERLQYYLAFCEAAGLDPVTQPAQYLQLQGRTVLYITRAGTDQLRARNNVSITITARELLDGNIYVVSARAVTPDGRTDESIGAVHVGGLTGDALANAFMKAETKAKRRVTLSICGLGLMDESEIDSIPDARPVYVEEVQHLAQTRSGRVESAPAAGPGDYSPVEDPPSRDSWATSETLVSNTPGRLQDSPREAEWPAEPLSSADELIEWVRDMVAAGILNQKQIADWLGSHGYNDRTLSGRIRAAVADNPELLVPAAWRDL